MHPIYTLASKFINLRFKPCRRWRLVHLYTQQHLGKVVTWIFNYFTNPFEKATAVQSVRTKCPFSVDIMLYTLLHYVRKWKNFSALARLWISTISFVPLSFLLPVRQSVILSTWNYSSPTKTVLIKFNIWIFFENVSRIFKFYLKSDFTWRPMLIFWRYLTQFFLEREMFQTKVVEKFNKHFILSKGFSEIAPSMR